MSLFSLWSLFACRCSSCCLCFLLSVFPVASVLFLFVLVVCWLFVAFLPVLYSATAVYHFVSLRSWCPEPTNGTPHYWRDLPRSLRQRCGPPRIASISVSWLPLPWQLHAYQCQCVGLLSNSLKLRRAPVTRTTVECSKEKAKKTIKR